MKITFKSVSVVDIAISREERVKKQKELLSLYKKTLICFTLNIAGEIKNSPLIMKGFLEGKRAIETSLYENDISVIHSEARCLFTGNEAFYVVSHSPLNIKKIVCEIEEHHPIGRLFDIDVIDENGNKIERESVGMSERKCLICSSPVALCGRNRTHSAEDLKKRTEEILTEYLLPLERKNVAKMAVKALLYELSITPKPGLVDMNNNGSHSDMDRFTFIDSALSLIDYFEDCFNIGYTTKNISYSEVLKLLKQEGKRAEAEMFMATSGVNTHKGAIFALGLVVSCVGRLAFSDYGVDDIIKECSSLCGSITKNELETNKTSSTFGEKCYKEHSIKGARGEAEEGYKSILKGPYDVLKHCLSSNMGVNRAGAITLLYIIISLDDTSLIHRSGFDGAERVKEKIRNILKDTPYPSEQTLRELDEYFIKNAYSSGGAADMLSLCFFVYFIEKEGERV